MLYIIAIGLAGVGLICMGAKKYAIAAILFSAATLLGIAEMGVAGSS